MNSPTYGTVSMDEIAAIIKSKVENDSGEFNIMIGTDSQNFHETKMVIVIALHHVGHPIYAGVAQLAERLICNQ